MIDHLPLPSKPTLGNLEISFLSSQPYDGGPLLTYPQRNGWKLEYNLPKKECTVSYQLSVEPTEGVASLVQTWLYFGMLCEFLEEPVDTSLFQVKNHANRVILSTRSLERLVCDRIVQLRDNYRSTSHVEALDRWKEQTYSAILEARHNCLLIAYTQNEAPESPLALTSLAIAALGEYLSFAIGHLCLHLGLESPVQQTWRLFGDVHADCGQSIQSLMLRLGWCPSKLAQLNLAHTRHVSSLWYFANLIPPRAAESHESCSSEQCALLRIDKAQYEVAHSSAGCDCTYLGPDQSRLESIVREGSLPIVTVQEDPASGLSTLHAEEYTAGQAFVAVSHVWADGRGNADENSLPTCTLHELQDLINGLPGMEPLTSTPFWMDTLCVPRNPKNLRKKALKRLRDPYDLASHVLIIDSYLRSHNASDVHMTEVLARIACSGWTQRLWTFQEGRLATRTWFAFRDKCIDPRAAVDQWHETFGRIPPLASHDVDLSMITNHTSTTVYPQIPKDYASLVMLRLALRTRATSVQSDEALCLGSILGLDMDAIVEASAATRMQVLWSLVPAIPKGLVFSQTKKKLEGKGFRWAPASLMGELDESLWEGPNGINSTFDTSWTSSGLKFQQAAWIFGCPGHQSPSTASKQSLLRKFDPVRTPIPNDDLGLEMIRIRDAAGQWFDVTLDRPWHQSPKPINYAEEPILLIDRPHEFGDGTMRRPSSDFSPQGNNLALLATCSSVLAADSVIQVTVHRHAGVSMLSRKSQQHATILMQCCDTLVANHAESIRKMEGDEEGMEKTVRELVEPILRETNVLELTKDIRRSQQRTTDYASVLAACVFHIAWLCLFGPWCLVREADSEVTWCVD